MRRAEFRIIPPRSAAAAKPKRSKPAARHIEHAVYGLGRVLAVRQIDGSDGDYMADVKFADGITRTLLLLPRFWLTDIATLIPTPPKHRPVKAEPQPVDRLSRT